MEMRSPGCCGGADRGKGAKKGEKGTSKGDQDGEECDFVPTIIHCLFT